MARPLAEIDGQLLARRGIARRVAWRMWPGPAWCELCDLEAECWFGVWVGLLTFDPARGPLDPWLFLTARSAGRDFLKGEGLRGRKWESRLDRRADLGDLPAAAACEAEPPRCNWAAILRRVVAFQRVPLVMRFRDGKSYAEIARACDLSGENAARAVVSRAVRRLRGGLGKDVPTGD